jgi:hypothetical protein
MRYFFKKASHIIKNKKFKVNMLKNLYEIFNIYRAGVVAEGSSRR